MAVDRYDLAAIKGWEQTLLLLDGIMIVYWHLQVLEEHGLGLYESWGALRVYGSRETTIVLYLCQRFWGEINIRGVKERF